MKGIFKNKKIISLVVVLLIVILIISILFFRRFGAEENNKSEVTVNDSNNVNIVTINTAVNLEKEQETSSLNIHLPTLTQDLVKKLEPDMSRWAIKKDGLIYYARNQENKKRIMVLDEEGREHERWSSGSAESYVNIEIAGYDDKRIIFIFSDKNKPMTCSELWNGDYRYYGIGYGTDNYSGAIDLSLEEDKQLLTQMQAACRDN